MKKYFEIKRDAAKELANSIANEIKGYVAGREVYAEISDCTMDSETDAYVSNNHISGETTQAFEVRNEDGSLNALVLYWDI